VVQGTIKIPKHGGPDGQGLKIEVIEELLSIIQAGLFTEGQINQAIELCLSASTQAEWNDIYVPLLFKELNRERTA
jgi:hypothetical protein